MHNTILRLSDVKARTGLSRSSIYAFMKAGTFPAKFNLGPRSVGWNAALIDQWIQNRMNLVSDTCRSEII